MRNRSNLIIISYIAIALALFVSNSYAEDISKQDKLEKVKKLEMEFHAVSKRVDGMLKEQNIDAALSYARSLESGYLQAIALLQIAQTLRTKVAESNAFLNEALLAARSEPIKGLRATTLVLISDNFKMLQNEASSLIALREAKDTVLAIDHYDTSIELSAVFAVAKAFASRGQKEVAESIAKRINATTGDPLMSQIDKLDREFKQKR